jgi:NhaP-type Na+/H+ or K+/H+ antiporter
VDTSFIIYAATALFAYGLVSKRLAPTAISGPMVFVGLGLVASVIGLLEPIRVVDSPVGDILELTLALLLFTDAAKVQVRSWSADMDLPTRLLTIGMPLTIVLGSFVALLVFPTIGLIAALIVATILAPTDAALGSAVVTNKHVPIRIREALGIESGLNDGIALPILLFLLTLGEAAEGVDLWSLFFEEIGIGLLVGVGLGAGAAFAIRFAIGESWIARPWVRISMVAAAFFVFLVADDMGGSGFIAAYVGGNTFGRIVEPVEPASGKLGEDLGTILTMISFLIFGAYILGPNLDLFTGRNLIYGILSLTAVRTIPVVISMIGAGVRRPTVAFLGWFGPRGLASIIFAGVLVEATSISESEVIVAVVVVTVTLSVVLHGMTAPWGANRYATWYNEQDRISDDVSQSRSGLDNPPGHSG